MATKTLIKTDHPFTKSQLTALNKELEKISNVQLVAAKGLAIPGKKDYTDIEILHSPYMLDVFLSYMDISVPDRPKSVMCKISETGQVDYKTRMNLQFNSLADRVTFFNSLYPINFKD